MHLATIFVRFPLYRSLDYLIFDKLRGLKFRCNMTGLVRQCLGNDENADASQFKSSVARQVALVSLFTSERPRLRGGVLSEHKFDLSDTRPYLSALEVRHDEALYKSMFTLLLYKRQRREMGGTRQRKG